MSEVNRAFRRIFLLLAGILVFLLLVSCDNTIPTRSNGSGSYTLSISAINGAITKSPDKATYTNGEVVTLSAIASSGYSFSSWSGDASGTNATTTVTMNGDKSVSASFTAIKYVLTTIASNGTVIKKPNKTTYNYGDTVAITAIADSGYSFINWSGDASGVNETSIVTIDENKSITASFTIAYTLAITGINGRIAKLPDKAKYLSGENVTLFAFADSAYTFSNWSGDASGTNARTTVSMNCNKSVSANFIAWDMTVKDIDGNLYHTVKIGHQIWTVENLRTTKYDDGSSIVLDTSTTTWYNGNTGSTIGKYCFYDNTTNSDSMNRFGALYNWYAVRTGNIAPAGWHVPTNAEWDTLQNYLIANGYNWDSTTDSNKIAKSLAAKTEWKATSSRGAIGNDLTRNNYSNFSAFPGGYRDGSRFYSLGVSGFWWSATMASSFEAYYCWLCFTESNLGRVSFSQSMGYSIRLLKD